MIAVEHCLFLTCRYLHIYIYINIYVYIYIDIFPMIQSNAYIH